MIGWSSSRDASTGDWAQRGGEQGFENELGLLVWPAGGGDIGVSTIARRVVEASHFINLYDMHHKYADVVSLDMAKSYFEGLAEPMRKAG